MKIKATRSRASGSMVIETSIEIEQPICDIEVTARQLLKVLAGDITPSREITVSGSLVPASAVEGVILDAMRRGKSDTGQC